MRRPSILVQKSRTVRGSPRPCRPDFNTVVSLTMIDLEPDLHFAIYNLHFEIARLGWLCAQDEFVVK